MGVRVIGVCGRKGSGKDAVGKVLVEGFGFVRVALADPIKQLAYRIFGYDEETLFGPSAKREQLTPDAVSAAWWERVYSNVESAAVSLVLRRHFARPEIAQQELVTLCVHTLEPLGGDLTPRVVLQQMGTEWGRRLYDDIWVDEVLRVVAQLADPSMQYHPLLGVSPSRVPIERAGVVITDVRFENEVRAVQHYSGGGRVWTVNAQERLLPQVLGEHASEPAYKDTAVWANTIIDNNGPVEALRPEVESAAAALQLQKIA